MKRKYIERLAREKLKEAGFEIDYHVWSQYGKKDLFGLWDVQGIKENCMVFIQVSAKPIYDKADWKRRFMNSVFPKVNIKNVFFYFWQYKGQGEWRIWRWIYEKQEFMESKN